MDILLFYKFKIKLRFLFQISKFYKKYLNNSASK